GSPDKCRGPGRPASWRCYAWRRWKIGTTRSGADRMSYALATIWHERSRFLPAILAVAFSAVLIAVQAGVLVGLLSMMSTPVDKADADVWVGYPGVRSVDLGQAVPQHYRNRVAAQPEVREVEEVEMGFAQWVVPPNATRKETLIEACMIIGT